MRYYLGVLHDNINITRDEALSLIQNIQSPLLFTTARSAAAYTVQLKHHLLKHNSHNAAVSKLGQYRKTNRIPFVMIYELEGPFDAKFNAMKKTLIVDGDITQAYELENLAEFELIHCAANINNGIIFYSDKSIKMFNKPETLELDNEAEPAKILPFKPTTCTCI